MDEEILFTDQIFLLLSDEVVVQRVCLGHTANPKSEKVLPQLRLIPNFLRKSFWLMANFLRYKFLPMANFLRKSCSKSPQQLCSHNVLIGLPMLPKIRPKIKIEITVSSRNTVQCTVSHGSPHESKSFDSCSVLEHLQCLQLDTFRT